MNDTIKKLIADYKVYIKENGLKDERYKWELIKKLKGKPDINAQDFALEIKGINLKENNLVYQMAKATSNRIALYKPEEYRLSFQKLFDEELPLDKRINDFQIEILKIYKSTEGQHSSHHDERTISTYLTFHNPEKYTFYKSSYYYEYCKLLQIQPKDTGEKYIHYLELIHDLIDNYIFGDVELQSLVDVELKKSDCYLDKNRMILAQDILYQMLIIRNLDSNNNYWVFQGNPQIFDIVSALNDNNLKTWMVNAHKKSIKEGDKIILWLTGKNSGCYALAEVTSEVYYGIDDDIELKYYLKNEENEESDRVNIRITHNLSKNPILKSQIENNDELKNLKGGYQGTNFKATQEEYNAILKLVIMKNENDKNYSFREDYIKWLNIEYPIESGTKSAYIRSIDLLSEILKEDLFKTNEIPKLNELYEDLKLHQRDVKGKYYVEGSSSYGNKYFYTAAIKTYIKFHQGLKGITIDSIQFKIFDFQEDILKSGLAFSEKMLTRFTSSLLTKPFVILTGLSGSGKTKLAQAFAMWLCADKTQYKIVPVGADWTNREPLLGFPNGLDAETYVTPDSGALELIINASKEENQDKPYFLILDEMNLSHVERYFADFLSVMESNENVKLYSGAERISSDGTIIPTEIAWPKNLFIVGTVNIDETTYMFSPKVLDRANVIEFRVAEKEMEDYLQNYQPLNMDALKAQGASMAADFVHKAIDKSLVTPDTDLINKALLAFFTELKKSGAEFGYRSASEILRFAAVASTIEPNWKPEEIIDAAIMQKLLPKVHGSRNKLSKILPVLGSFCLKNAEKVKEAYLEDKEKTAFETDDNVIYKLSFEKICRMYRNAIENGYASYAEA